LTSALSLPWCTSDASSKRRSRSGVDMVAVPRSKRRMGVAAVCFD
jgi:hypothetical protein